MTYCTFCITMHHAAILCHFFFPFNSSVLSLGTAPPQSKRHDLWNYSLHVFINGHHPKPGPSGKRPQEIATRPVAKDRGVFQLFLPNGTAQHRQNPRTPELQKTKSSRCCKMPGYNACGLAEAPKTHWVQ